jgi:hypothetical protein
MYNFRGTLSLTLNAPWDFGYLPHVGDAVEVNTTNSPALAAGANWVDVSIGQAPQIGQAVIITSGAGLGQMRTVTNFLSTSVNGASAYQLFLNQPWTLTPDSTSDIEVVSDTTNSIFYQNNFSDQAGPNGAQDYISGNGLGLEASDGFEVFTGAYGLVFDGNTTSNLLTGLSLWSAYTSNPCYFIDVINNQFNNSQTGLFLTGSQNSTSPNFIGVAVRNNTMNTVIYNPSDPPNSGQGIIVDKNGANPVHGNAANTQVPAAGPTALAVFEQNTLENAPVGISIDDDQNNLIDNNSFNAAASAGPTATAVLFGGPSPSALLLGNIYENYAQTYRGSAAQSLTTPYQTYSLAIPHDSSAALSILLENAGSTTLTWTATSNQLFVTFQSLTGTISPESTSSALLTVDDIPAPGSYTATLTFTSGLQNRLVVLLLTIT